MPISDFLPWPFSNRPEPVIEPVPAQPPVPVQPAHHQPPQFPDTIGQARPAPTDYQPSRPNLLELRLLGTVERLRQANEDSLLIAEDRFEIAKADLQKLLRERSEKLKEAAEQTQAAGVWDTLRKIGAAILAAVSAFLGLTLFSAGGSALLGGALIVSGSLALANLAFTDSGLWDWMAEKIAADDEEKQRKIAAAIPFVINVIACGAGLAGFGAFAMWGALPAAPRALAVLQIAANFLLVGGTAATKISQARLSLSQADLQELKHKLGENHHYVEELSERIEDILKHETDTFKQAKNILDLSRQIHQSILA